MKTLFPKLQYRSEVDGLKTLIPKLQYRPEVDGLRAVAILSVLFYHAGFGCHGGYVGVDVFFVISGFLITSLIWNDLEAGRFTFAQFWERRARRIVPASVVVMAVVVAAGLFLLLPPDLEALGRAAASQAAFGANIYYWRTTGYFGGNTDEMPLLHTWSLAVEEQFYFIVPFILWGMFRFPALRSRPAVLSVLLAGFVISFATSVWGVHYRRDATFYLLPTRAWELLLGALVAFLPVSPRHLARGHAREFVAIAGMLLILFAVFTYSPETLFPGPAAIPPCLGTALVIWANQRRDGDVPTFLGKALSVRPLVFIGLISYSLYLWHWPLLAFSTYLSPLDLSLSQRLAAVGVAFLAAVLSWRCIETPFRKRRVGTTRKSVFAFAGVGLTAVLAGGLLCMFMRGFPQRVPPQAQQFSEAEFDMSFINELSVEDVRSGKLVPLGVSGRASRSIVLVWGDSHAMAALPAVDELLKERRLSGCAATHSSTPPVLDWYTQTRYGLDEDAPTFNDSVFEHIKRHQIPIVILSARWGSYAARSGHDGTPFAPSLLATVRRLISIGSQPWILMDVPQHRFDIPKTLAQAIWFGTGVESLCTRPTADNAWDGFLYQTIDEIARTGGRVIDPKPRFLSPDGRYYLVELDGVVLYRDRDHLTTSGARRVLLPLLRDALGEKLEMASRSLDG